MDFHWIVTAIEWVIKYVPILKQLSDFMNSGLTVTKTAQDILKGPIRPADEIYNGKIIAIKNALKKHHSAEKKWSCPR